MNPHSPERLPAVLDMARVPAYCQQHMMGAAEEDQEFSRAALSEYLIVLRRYRWRILGFCLFALVATAIVTARMVPIYESTATVDVDRQTPVGVVGQEAARAATNDADQFLATQMRLVQSDSVLRPVDQRFGLRAKEGQNVGAPRAASAPVALKQLKVTRPPNTYLIQISYRSEDPQLAADSANAITQSYLEHTYNIRVRSSASVAEFMERQLDELRAKMERSNLALATLEREMNVVNPEEKTNILGSRLLQLNTDYTSAQGDRLRKQAAYESIAGGSVEAALGATQGDALRKLAEHLNTAREQFAEVASYYGSSHPEYRRTQAALNEAQVAFEATRKGITQRVEIEFRESQRREEMAKQAVGEAKTEFDHVNTRSFEYQGVKREAESDKKLYEELLRKIKEAGINAGFQNSSIRVADPARPGAKPVSPNMFLNLSLALLFAMILGVAVSLVSDTLDKTIRDPEQVARTLRTEVIGSLPLMKNKRGNRARPKIATGETADSDPSGFHESVRTLRNSILLANAERPFKSLLVTSAAPSEGKTTTAANLAAAHAEQGKRTLLIDGDLRRPNVHRNFGLPSVVGLSNVLLGELPWREALLQPEGIPGLDVLPAGPPSRKASDLVGRGLVEVLEEASAEYDLVILDAPPLLGFAEPLQMAIAVDGVIIVARAGQTSRKAVASVIATLTRLRAKVLGIVLNEVHKELSDSYYYYGYYRSYYRPRPEDEADDRALAKKEAAKEKVGS